MRFAPLPPATHITPFHAAHKQPPVNRLDPELDTFQLNPSRE